MTATELPGALSGNLVDAVGGSPFGQHLRVARLDRKYLQRLPNAGCKASKTCRKGLPTGRNTGAISTTRIHGLVFEPPW
jgi:hypothetical protein